MKKETDSVKFIKMFDRHKHLFGIKIEGEKGWHIEPLFEEIGISIWSTPTEETWFKQQGKYGYCHIGEGRIIIPAMYGFPLYFGKNGQCIAWKDYKAGVIDKENQVLIPFVYDEIRSRYKRVTIPEEPTMKDIFHGYACRTNEGGEQAYDEHCQPEAFEDGEQKWLHWKPAYDNPEVTEMTLAELEEHIKKEYVILIELGYGHFRDNIWSKEHREKVDAQEEKVSSLLSDRRLKMNRCWVHNVENAKRIGRTNDLLMRAVRKAIRLGKKTSKSLQWMEKVSNAAEYEVRVFVHPLWENSKSDLRYKRQYKSSAKEQERLADETDNEAGTHIWNIIAAMARGGRFYGVSSCFWQGVDKYTPGYWSECELTLDDGQSWDEGLHYPAYQDVYFTHPFHALCQHGFLYSNEDLCNINEFRVNVEMSLVTKEQN